jgi:hypothetical protein
VSPSSTSSPSDDDDDAESAGAGSGLISAQKFHAKNAFKAGADKEENKAAVAVDWGRIAAKLPWGTDENSKTKRRSMFRSFDPNGNGLLSRILFGFPAQIGLQLLFQRSPLP